MSHYVWYENQVKECPNWQAVAQHPDETYGFSPKDPVGQGRYFQLIQGHRITRTWRDLHLADLPKPFRLALLVHGISV